VDLEAPPPSPDAYVDMWPVDTSHYQGLWGLQQDQQQDDEEEEPQPFLMELVSASTSYITLSCPHAAVIVCSLFAEVRGSGWKDKEQERDFCFNVFLFLKFIYSIGE
jgi:hypothetical protein